MRALTPKAPRRLRYPPELVAALAVCWRITRASAGKRLAPMLKDLVPLLRRERELVLSDAQADALMAMSPATIDRRLAPIRARMVWGAKNPALRPCCHGVHDYRANLRIDDSNLQQVRGPVRANKDRQSLVQSFIGHMNKFLGPLDNAS